MRLLALALACWSGQSESAETPTIDPAALVTALGSAKFADRDAAQERLIGLGRAARPALRQGLTHADLEVAGRCREALSQMRERFVEGETEFGGPAWPRFKAVAGDTRSARRLFWEAAHDDARLEALDTAASDPAKANRLYRIAVGRASWSYLRYRIAMHDPSDPNKKNRAETPRRTASVGEVAAALFLGVLAPAYGGPDPAEVSGLFHFGFADSVAPATREATQQLYVAWLRARRSPEAVEAALFASLHARFDDAVPFAREYLENREATPKGVALAIAVLGRHGDRSDVARLGRFRADTRVAYHFHRDPAQYRCEVRDVAACYALGLQKSYTLEFGHGPMYLFSEAFPTRSGFVQGATVDPGPFMPIQGDPARYDENIKKAWVKIDAQAKK